MTHFLMEAVILAFTLGGIVGAISALHIQHRVATVKIRDKLEMNNNH